MRLRVGLMRLPRVLLLLSLLTPARATSEFWLKAQRTLLLSQTRSAADPPAPAAPTRDPVLDMPRFLPLCGNGRVDTKADYAAYYSDPRNLPLSLTRQQLLYQTQGVVNPGAVHNITILADEECDDGNRLDLDGCSADCMHMDLWTSPCEIAVDGPPLVYEDIVYDPVRGAMVVSALDGVYSLETSLDAAVRPLLLAPKSFPVTSLLRLVGSLILYSAKLQCFWRLPDGASSATLLRNFSGTGPGLLKAWDAQGYINGAGSIIVHDDARFLYFSTAEASPVSCNSPRLGRCLFAQPQGASSLFHCDNYTTQVSVLVGPGVCQIDPGTGASPGDTSLLYDALYMTARQTGFTRVAPYSMDVTISPPEPLVSAFTAVLMYSPWGLLLESPVASPRKLASTGLSPNQMHFIGDPNLARMLTLQEDNCGPGHCVFDARLGYDLLAQNPYKGAGPATWTDVLQGSVAKEAGETPALANISAIRADPARYARLISVFADTFRWSTAPLAILELQVHPPTRNLWALRGDRLVVISKSGVQLQRADGKCLPSGVGLCPACQWAPSGLPCRPCSASDPTSWAWAARCKGTACAGRRLLAAGGTTTIRFVLAGNLSTVLAAWPDAVASGSLYSVAVVTTDPVADMRTIRTRLAAMPDVQVVTQPYEPILVGTPPNTTPAPAPTPKDDNTAVIITMSVLVPVAVIVTALVAWGVYSSPTSNGYSPLAKP